jgi:hypothetical protein
MLTSDTRRALVIYSDHREDDPGERIACGVIEPVTPGSPVPSYP